MGSLQCLRVGGASVKSSTSLYDTNTSLLLCCNTHAISFIPFPNVKTQDSILTLTLTRRNRGVVAAVAEEDLGAGAEEEISVGRTLKIGEAVAHGMGQVGSTVCMSKNDVSFTHVIRSAEPAFSVIFSQIFMGEKRFPLPVYMSLLPIIGGCALAAATQLNCNMIDVVVGSILCQRVYKYKSLSNTKL
ncbi:hypothetical protein KI387_034649, partial [Taxus chinensis]